MMKGNRNPPAFAKVTQDKMLLCSLCGELVKNEMQWNLKHVNTQRHRIELKKIKEQIAIEKDNGNKDNGEPNEELKDDDIIKTEVKNKNTIDKEKEKERLIKEALGFLDYKYKEDQSKDTLPIDFFDLNEEIKGEDGNIKGNKNVNGTNKLSDYQNKNTNENNKDIIEEHNIINDREPKGEEDNDEDNYQSDIESEIDNMISSAHIINNIIEKYQYHNNHQVSNNRFLNKKRNSSNAEHSNDTSAPSNNQKEKEKLSTAEDLISEILNDDW